MCVIDNLDNSHDGDGLTPETKCKSCFKIIKDNGILCIDCQIEQFMRECSILIEM